MFREGDRVRLNMPIVKSRWSWWIGQADGNNGTVVEDLGGSSVMVQWDNGHRNSYRIEGLLHEDAESPAIEGVIKEGMEVLLDETYRSSNMERWMRQSKGDKGIVTSCQCDIDLHYRHGDLTEHIYVRWENGHHNSYPIDSLVPTALLEGHPVDTIHIYFLASGRTITIVEGESAEPLDTAVIVEGDAIARKEERKRIRLSK